MDVKVEKAKGHATKQDVERKRVKAIDAVGSHEADRAAVQVAKRAEVDCPRPNRRQ